MLPLKIFTFSPFQENMYILSTDNKECIVFDPGCFYPQEQDTLISYLNEKKITPKRLINTHSHIDHIFGNALIHRTYHILPEIHQQELQMLTMAPAICEAYGFEMPDPSPIPEQFIEEGDIIELGAYKFLALLTPGHSVASLSFYCESHGFLIAGDVLFKESIGRTDLPGGDHDTLINVVKEKLFTLPNDTIVYPGHGPHTTIGYEKRNNPFFQ